MSTEHSRKFISVVKLLSEGVYILVLVVLHIRSTLPLCRTPYWTVVTVTCSPSISCAQEHAIAMLCTMFKFQVSLHHIFWCCCTLGTHKMNMLILLVLSVDPNPDKIWRFNLLYFSNLGDDPTLLLPVHKALRTIMGQKTQSWPLCSYKYWDQAHLVLLRRWKQSILLEMRDPLEAKYSYNYAASMAPRSNSCLIHCA